MGDSGTTKTMDHIDTTEIRLGNRDIVVSKAYGRPEQVTLHGLCDEIDRLRGVVDALTRTLSDVPADRKAAVERALDAYEHYGREFGFMVHGDDDAQGFDLLHRLAMLMAVDAAFKSEST